MRLAYHAACVVVAATLPALALGCGASGTRQTETDASATSLAATPDVAGTAPSDDFAVGIRTLDLLRSEDRPLPTTVWYPAAGDVSDVTEVTPDAEPADSRFPLVLVSHGLTGLPSDLAPVTMRLAAAGFIVVAPTYPNTNRDAASIDPVDVLEQPADGLYVIDAVLALGENADDMFHNHVDANRLAVSGHSAGGYTTSGILSADHSAQIRAAVICSGGTLLDYTAPSASVLFVHGDADEVVPYATGRSAYTRLSWPKAFLTVLGGGHSDYLEPTAASFTPVVDTITDFLRLALYGDEDAGSRLQADATSSSTQYEQQSL